MPSIANLREIVREKLEADVFKRPPEEWRNVWWTREELEFTDGSKRGPGYFHGERVHPTKDVAETRAQEQINENHECLFSLGIIKWVEAERFS